MSTKKKSMWQRVVDPPDGERLEQLLDEALEESFPASDSVAIDFGPRRDNDASVMSEGCSGKGQGRRCRRR